jgi:hypothetical protein
MTGCHAWMHWQHYPDFSVFTVLAAFGRLFYGLWFFIGSDKSAAVSFSPILKPQGEGSHSRK